MTQVSADNGIGRPVQRWRRCALVVVAVLVAACSGGEGSVDRSVDDGSSSTTTTAAQTPVSADGPLPISLGEPVDATGTLRLGFGGAVALDPSTASPASIGDMVMSDLLYDTLVHLDAAGRPQPGIATFSADEENLVWTFEIRSDATFADGTPVSAADVQQSLERVMERGGASLASIRLGDIAAIETVAPTTLQITLAEPSTLLPEILASPLLGITDATTVASYGVGAIRPNPSGHYVVVAQSETEILLARRSGDGPEAVFVDMFATESDSLDAFLAGELDWTPVPGDRFEEAVQAAGTDGLVPFGSGIYLAIDPGNSPLDDRALRQAIALSVDRVSLVDQVYGPAAQPLLGIVPAGIPGGATEECRGLCGPDRGSARGEVERVYPDGQDRPLRLLVDDTPTMRAVANVLGEQIQASGFDVEVTAEDAVNYEQLIAAGQQQMFVFSWLGVARTPSEYLLPLFDSASPDNVLGYRNETVDAQLDVARSSLDPAVREQAWATVEAAVLDDAVVVPLVQLRTAAVVSERVDGLVVRIDGTLALDGVTIADG